MVIIRLAAAALVLALAVSALAANPHAVKPHDKKALTSKNAARSGAKGTKPMTAAVSVSQDGGKARKGRTLTAFEMDAAGINQTKY